MDTTLKEIGFSVGDRMAQTWRQTGETFLIMGGNEGAGVVN
jgi:hypothetical protein